MCHFYHAKTLSLSVEETCLVTVLVVQKSQHISSSAALIFIMNINIIQHNVHSDYTLRKKGSIPRLQHSVGNPHVAVWGSTSDSISKNTKCQKGFIYKEKCIKCLHDNSMLFLFFF